MKNFILKAKDKKIEHEILWANIFTNNFSKKLTKNQFFSPAAARLVLASKKHIYQYVLVNPLIKVNDDGDILVYSSASYAKISGKKPYWNNDEFLKYKILLKLYKQKLKIGLTNEEAIILSEAQSAIALHKIIKIKLPYEKGGGF